MTGSTSGYVAVSNDEAARLTITRYRNALSLLMEHRDPETASVKNWVRLNMGTATVKELRDFLSDWIDAVEALDAEEPAHDR